MIGLRFEWDEAKNRSNRRKHGVSFEEASQVFRDPLHLSTLDRVEDGEQRWRTIGSVGGCLILVVAHTIVEEGIDRGFMEIIRIISARRADRSERRRYENEES